LASVSGLPVNHFIAACNSNDVFTRYMDSGEYAPNASIQTISNAMDVGNPSNFARILEIFDNNFDEIRKHMSSSAFSDAQTEEIISTVFKEFNYILDPHTAVAYGGLQKWLERNKGQKGIIVSTAHALKFPSVVEKITGKKIEIPRHVEKIMQSEKKSIITEPMYEDVKSKILEIM
jgi:threonine synthase